MTKLATIFCLAFLCTAAAHAQNLVVEFEVPRGYRPAFKGSDEELQALLEVRNRDLNGDGSPEVVMMRDDAQGTPQELVVVDVAPSPPEVLWTLDLSFLELSDNVEMDFYGFFALTNPHHDGMRAAVFGGEGIQVFHPDSDSEVVFSLDADHRLIGVLDVDGDDLAELIIDNKVGGVFEVWGAGGDGQSRH